MGTQIIDTLTDIAKDYGYKVFKNSINIWGVRKTGGRAGQWDDKLYAFWTNPKKVYAYDITTDPGLYWLKNPMNVEGTAILVPGQFPRLWSMGYHRGQYEALIQTGPCKVYRDNNRDGIFDFDSPIDAGWFGINCHHSGSLIDKPVGRWSAGCQVFRFLGDFIAFRQLCKKEAAKFGNHFTYTLIESRDIDRWEEKNGKTT